MLHQSVAGEIFYLPCYSLCLGAEMGLFTVAEESMLVWIDLEMSGLDFAGDRILEIACIVTDSQLQAVGSEFDLALHQSEVVLTGMDEWNTRTHNDSGLVDRVRASRCDEQQAEALVLDFLNPLLSEAPAILCGNSICTDRRFIARYFPALEARLHYRMVDVSSIKELARRWRPDLYRAKPKKELLHRALDDIRDSLRELRFYREHWLVAAGGSE